MLVKTKPSQAITDFLKKDLIQNLNISGIINNEKNIEIYIDNEFTPRSIFVRREYYNYIYTKDDNFLEEVLEKHFRKDGYYGFSGMERSVAQKIKSHYNELDWDNPHKLYYMPKENLDLSLIKNPVRGIDIKYAETIDKFYEYRNEGSLDDIKSCIIERPSSTVYMDGEPVCWVLVHKDDSMGFMYTREEYRKRGLAIDVTLDLASKVFEEGKIPFIQISEHNNMSPGLAKKCGFVQCGYADWFGIKVGTPNQNE